MDDSIVAALRKWKKRQFIDKHVQLATIGKAIRDGKEPFKMVCINHKRWMCMSKDTGLPAVFTYPVCWNSNTDLRAGNFLPTSVEDTGNFKPVREISVWLSKIAYYFDVNIDSGFIENMTLLEDYIQRDENFNLTGKRRKDWQNGSVKHGRYQIEHKLFAHSGNNYAELQGAELDGVHPWLIDAIKAQSAPQKYNINVPFPSYVDYTEKGGTTSILENNPPTFSKRDVVVITFRLGFILGADEWGPEILPDEFIRVEKANRDESERYVNSNWPGRDPSVKRLGVSRKPSEWPSTGLQGFTHTYSQSTEDDQGDVSTSELDDDSLSQHSTDSIKRRIKDLAVEEEMVIVDSHIDQDQEMEALDEEVTRPKSRKKNPRK